jgi:hypothetical protein
MFRAIPPPLLRPLLLLLVAVVSLGCNPCDRDGCDALQRVAASSDETRLAGSVAELSDVVENGCQECGLAETELRVWARSGPTDPSRTTQITESPALASVSVKAGKYALPLEAGDYLVCVRGRSCFDISVSEGGTTTMNVRLVSGISRAYLGAPKAKQLSELDAIGPQ